MSEELFPGLRVGRYQLLFRLGKGGMGEVWAAAQTSDFGFQKLIALKVLRSREVSSNATVMFFDEAKAASSLQHAAVVSTVDLGRDGDVLYIAMDLVRGPSLTALLQRLVLMQSSMTPAIVSYLGTQLASALDYAHERATFEGKKLKLIHRDISPHNVLLDLAGNVRLTDFGVARTAIQDHKSSVGTVRGKPSYMAPEQVVGGDIDARSDIFSLGIVLYECACLRRLFGRSNPVKSMDAVIKHTPKPLVELVPGFPRALGDAIARALHKNPRDRYASAAEFAETLSEVSKTLPDGGTASLDLARLIEVSFPKDAFDLDGRVKEALAIAKINLPVSNLGESEPPEPETRLERTPTQAPTAVLGPHGTRIMAWPTAHATDPLAPEALEEARTMMFASNTPAAPMPMGSMQSLDGLTAYSAGTHQTMLVQRQRQTSTLVAVLCSAALLLLAAAFAVVHGNRSAAAPDMAQAVELPAASAEVKALPTPAASVEQERRTVSAEADEPEGSEKEAARSGRRSGRRAPAIGGGPRHAEGEGEAKLAGDPPLSRESNATRDQVLKLIRQVKTVDPKAASEMYPTLNEAGTDNVRVLNALRARAQAILSRRPE